MTKPSRLASTVYGLVGLSLFIGIWQLVGAYELAGLTWPRFTTVISYLAEPSRWGLFSRALQATLWAMGVGYIVGGIAGFSLAVLSAVFQPLRPMTDTTSAVIHAIPAIAIAPLLIILLGSSVAPAALSALNVFFIMYVSTVAGLSATTPAHRDVFRVLGSSRFQQLCRLELPNALSSIVTGLRLAAPASMIGAIIGEWFGAPRGVGLLIVSAMQNFQIPLLWSAIVLATLTSAAAYGLFGLLERVIHSRFS